MAKAPQPIDVDNAPLYFTPQEVADIRRVGRTSVYEALKRGEIEHIRMGRLIRIPRDVALGRRSA